jgi:enoyl-CoA hydratase/carnithine racemase
MSAEHPVRLEREDGLAVVTFDSPPLNLFDRAIEEGLEAVLAELERERPRAVLFRAEGRVFSGGVDLVMLARRVNSLPCPTILAAHSLCLTWAFELALACDFILAAESARFGLVEKVIGLTPAMGGTQRLAERAGTGRAREFVMTGDRYTAAELERWNVVNRVFPDAEFEAEVWALARRLAADPTLAHAATKRVIQDFIQGGVELANDRVGAVAGELFATDDLQGAVQSFLEQGPGKATFHGR